MDDLSPLAAYHLLRFAPGHLERLHAALEQVRASKPLRFERKWLTHAVEAMAEPVDAVARVLEMARALAELEEVRPDFLTELQLGWVDALERLFAGITFHVGPRAPILEALFPHPKFPALRKASTEVALLYASEFERRLKSGYVTRMRGQPDFTFMPAVLEQVDQAVLAWRSLTVPADLAEADAARALSALLKLGRTLERLIQQTRMVAQAALLPLEGAFEASGLAARPRRRATLAGGALAEASVDVAAETAAPAETVGTSPIGEPSAGPLELEASTSTPAGNPEPAAAVPPKVRPRSRSSGHPR